jgi:hypothetical protein
MNSPRSINRIQLGTILLFLGACANNSEVSVELNAHHQPSTPPRLLDVQAQVTGPQSGLHYKWFSVLGELNPQETETPRSSFTFATSSPRDRIWVEVWRDNERVAEGNLDVNMESGAPPENEPRPRVEIAITEIPRYEPAGGPDTRADIGGRVTGELTRGYDIVIYARADAWYIQPVPFALHPIEADGSWKSWTHTGSSYAALVVRNDYKPLTRLDVLPPVEGSIVARTIVDGKRP